MKQALFFDIDGTLMVYQDGSDYIPQSVIQEIQRLKKLGYYVFIASGRPIGFLSPKLKKVGFDGYVLCNGSHIEVNHQLLYAKPLPYQEVKALVSLLDTLDCEYDFETTTNCYINPKFKHFIDFFYHCDIDQDKLLFEFDNEEVMKRTLKMEIYLRDGSKKLKDYIEGRFGYDCHGTANSFEIYSLNDSKASGIIKVLDYLKISQENSYAFGDGLNDLEMISLAGHGIAMGNACFELKAIADEVIGRVDENGLANYLALLK